MSKLIVNDAEIQVIKFGEEDYISLTDMVRNIENGVVLIEKWLRNKNTIEFLGIWEELYNEEFNCDEYYNIMQEAGLNRFAMSVKQWGERTNSKGIVAKDSFYIDVFNECGKLWTLAPPKIRNAVYSNL